MTERERLLELHRHGAWWLAQASPAAAERIKRRLRRYRRALAVLAVLEQERPLGKFAA